MPDLLTREKLTPEERRRGELIHRVLASIEYTEEGMGGKGPSGDSTGL